MNTHQHTSESSHFYSQPDDEEEPQEAEPDELDFVLTFGHAPFFEYDDLGPIRYVESDQDVMYRLAITGVYQ